MMLLGVCASGLLASKILLEFGRRSMLVRYLIAVCCSYAVFFLLKRIWLWYVGASSKDDPPLPDLDVGDAIDIGQMPVDAVRGAQDRADGAFSGGDFGGGGATEIWGDASTVSGSVDRRQCPAAGAALLEGREDGTSIWVMLMTGVFGWVAQKHSPHASRLADIFKHSSSENR